MWPPQQHCRRPWRSWRSCARPNPRIQRCASHGKACAPSRPRWPGCSAAMQLADPELPCRWPLLPRIVRLPRPAGGVLSALLGRVTRLLRRQRAATGPPPVNPPPQGAPVVPKALRMRFPGSRARARPRAPADGPQDAAGQGPGQASGPPGRAVIRAGGGPPRAPPAQRLQRRPRRVQCSRRLLRLGPGPCTRPCATGGRLAPAPVDRGATVCCRHGTCAAVGERRRRRRGRAGQRKIARAAAHLLPVAPQLLHIPARSHLLQAVHHTALRCFPNCYRPLRKRHT